MQHCHSQLCQYCLHLHLLHQDIFRAVVAVGEVEDQNKSELYLHRLQWFLYLQS